MTDAHNIVTIMKNRLEKRQGKRWTLNEDQIQWLKEQISDQFKTSIRSRRNLTPGKVVLACAIKFVPENEHSAAGTSEIITQVDGTLKRRKATVENPSQKVSKNKVLHMSCKNLSMVDYDTEDASSVCLGDLQVINDLISKDSE